MCFVYGWIFLSGLVLVCEVVLKVWFVEGIFVDLLLEMMFVCRIVCKCCIVCCIECCWIDIVLSNLDF